MCVGAGHSACVLLPLLPPLLPLLLPPLLPPPLPPPPPPPPPRGAGDGLISLLPLLRGPGGDALSAWWHIVHSSSQEATHEAAT